MVDKIEMSLDEIIKSTRQPKMIRGKPITGVARKGNTPRRVPLSVPNRRRPVSGAYGGSASGGVGVLKGRTRGGIKPKFPRGDVNSAWKHDMYDGPKRGILKSAGSTSKLLVANLDYGVSDSDIKELFTEFGTLKKAAVHYDRSGRSLGTAEVSFERHPDAVKAIKQYNGVPLDGRPMSIILATPETSNYYRVQAQRTLPRSGPAPAGGASSNQRRRPAGGRQGGPNGGRRPPRQNIAIGGSAPPFTAGRRRKPNGPTIEELDAELDAYVNDMKM